jgi:hypothetical protein
MLIWIYTFSIHRALGLILPVGNMLKNKKYKRKCQYNDNLLPEDENRASCWNIICVSNILQYTGQCALWLWCNISSYVTAFRKSPFLMWTICLWILINNFHLLTALKEYLEKTDSSVRVMGSFSTSSCLCNWNKLPEEWNKYILKWLCFDNCTTLKAVKLSQIRRSLIYCKELHMFWLTTLISRKLEVKINYDVKLENIRQMWYKWMDHILFLLENEVNFTFWSLDMKGNKTVPLNNICIYMKFILVCYFASSSDYQYWNIRLCTSWLEHLATCKQKILIILEIHSWRNPVPLLKFDTNLFHCLLAIKTIVLLMAAYQSRM